MSDDLGNRMKRYERNLDIRITPHVPTILRIDGKAFHTYTRNCSRPYDTQLMNCFWESAIGLYKEIHYDLAYGQSDELSVLIYRPDTFSQEDFDGRLFKLSSIASSVVTANFNKSAKEMSFGERLAFFDCRVFQLPINEIVNYFIWRQQDASRNSIQMLGRANFSDKEMFKKSTNEIQDMVFKKYGINWNDIPTVWKRGWCCDKNLSIDFEIPIFTEDRNYIEKYLKTKDEENNAI